MPPAAPPPPAPHHLLRSLTITDGAHFSSAHVPFLPGLNCIIGGTGAGKTTLIQSTRFGVGVPATDPRAAQNEAQVLGTLGAGTVVVDVETQHAQRYRSERRAGEDPRVTDASGAPAPVSLHSELFKIDLYAQHEIHSIADDPSAQQTLLDKFAAAEIRALEDAIAQVERRLKLNAADAARLEAEIADAGDRTADLPSIAAALAAVTEATGPDADEVRLAHEAKVLRGREQAALRGLRDEVRAVLAGVDALEADARRRLGAEMTPALAASPNRAVLEQAHAGSRDALAVLHDAVARVRSALAAAGSAVSSAGDVLGAAHAGQEATYDALNRKHDADRGRLAERERLQRQFLELEALEKKLSDRRRELAARAAEAQAMRDERARLIAMELGVRKRVGVEIHRALDELVRITILSGADRREYLALLVELLKGTGIRSELVQQIAENVRPEDLAALIRANDPTPIQAVDEAKTNKAERAQRVIDALRSSTKLARVDVVRLRDLPVIELRLDGEYSPLTQLSSGQQCTAILLIILIESTAPLLVDQPEDQLDHAFIYEVLVPTLKRVKTLRQIVFSSHSPNIVVLGEADRIFVLAGTRSSGRVVELGTVDEVKASVERHVEGGREAFLERSKRYGHTP